jgi:hypothetical protein
VTEQGLGGDDVVANRELVDLIGEGPAQFPSKEKRSFKPWHRPRKQYVRDQQWLKELGYLARDLKLGGRELRYLTLPGDDLLDIRHIHDELCLSQNVMLRYLGFNSAANPEDPAQSALNSAMFAVRLLDYVDGESTIVPGDIRQVGNEKSIQWQHLRRFGTFHAINLDLCGGFAGVEKDAGIPSYFTTLDWILNNQARSAEDSLLFLTTRMDSDNINDVAMDKLPDLVREVLEACGDYKVQLLAEWQLQDTLTNLGLIDNLTPNEKFMLGLTQWVVTRAIVHGLKVNVRSLMSYRTGSTLGEDDIVSLAIRFKPDPFLLPDPAGLSKPTRPAQSELEKRCAQSVNIPHRVRGCVRVDDVLRTSVEDAAKCIERSSALLVASGYDSDSYREWIMSEGDHYALAK